MTEKKKAEELNDGELDKVQGGAMADGSTMSLNTQQTGIVSGGREELVKKSGYSTPKLDTDGKVSTSMSGNPEG